MPSTSASVEVTVTPVGAVTAASSPRPTCTGVRDGERPVPRNRSASRAIRPNSPSPRILGSRVRRYSTGSAPCWMPGAYAPVSPEPVSVPVLGAVGVVLGAVGVVLVPLS